MAIPEWKRTGIKKKITEKKIPVSEICKIYDVSYNTVYRIKDEMEKSK